MIYSTILGVTLGALCGLGIFTFGYAQAGSYLTDNPEACANCHAMREQYEGWLKATHRKAAVCNDCHTPAGFLGKYGTKALNGVMHSWAFTTGWYPEQIQIGKRNHGVTDGACLKCHASVANGLRAVRIHGEGVSCLRCHARVGHH